MKSFLMTVALIFSTTVFAGECFDANFVHGWNYDNHKEVLTVESFRDAYEVELAFSCRELPWAHAIGFKTFGGSFLVCRGDKVVVFNAWNEVVDSCPIRSIKKTK